MASAQGVTNPIIPDMIADPSIVKINGVYYCYATTDGYGKGLASSGPPVVWQSKDFVNWSFSGICFPSAAQQLYWAPSKAVFADGRFYLYPTINTSIYAAVADSPTGPFHLASGADRFDGSDTPDPLVKIKGPKGSKGIDAEVFVDDDGSAYMFWAQRGAARLHSNMTSIDTAVVVIPTKRKGYSEGPIVFKRKGIYYYLYTLEGHENYKYAYVYSTVSPFGPFVFPDEDIIASTDREQKIYGPGHGCVFNDPGTDNYYLAYLEFGIGGTNRQVWVDKLQFNADGTIRPVKLTQEGVGSLSGTKLKRNLALDAKIAASSQASDLKVKPVKDPMLDRVETYRPKNAIDGSNGTRWMSAAGDSLAFVTMDFGKVLSLKQSDVYFVQPTAGHAYRMAYSVDGERWQQCGGHAEVRIQSPHTDKLSVKARYLRLTVLQGTPGLWEWKVY